MKKTYKVSITADYDDPTTPYMVRAEFNKAVAVYKTEGGELILAFDKAIEMLEEEKALQMKQTGHNLKGNDLGKKDIISILTDCVSSTWGAKTFTEAQKLYDKFLERHNLSAGNNKGFNERNISRIQESDKAERKYSKEELKDYAWFHRSYIADLPNFRNPENQPIFEQWLDIKNNRETSIEARDTLDEMLRRGEIKLSAYLKIIKVIDK